MPLAVALLSALPLAWLVPNHYPPWPAAWSDGVALVLLASAAVAYSTQAEISRHWVLFIGLALLTVVAQALVGHIYFWGDAWMVGLYLSAFAVSIAMGSGATRSARGHSADVLSTMALGVLAGAIASVGIALVQWTGAISLGIWQADLPPGGRPYANVAQPNHLCTIAALGLAAAGLLKQRNHIGTACFWLTACWMLLGMVMTGSRTGWIQISAICLLLLLKHRSVPMGVRPTALLALAAIYVVGVLAWPTVNEFLMLNSSRSLTEAASTGTRRHHWAAALEALAREPWWGYGWQQISVAQVRGADLMPFVGEHIEYSHNLLLDLLLWNGLPIGIGLALLAGIWFVTRVWASREASSVWLLAAITAIGAHSLLEYPHAYAYFLLPLGVLIGAVDALERKHDGVTLSRRSIKVAGLVLGASLLWTGMEYVKAEQAFRLLRLESARVGTAGLTTPPPDLPLLNQLHAFLRFAHAEARTGMTADEVDQMRRVSERFAYPSAMFRYALAAGLNGQPEKAAVTLNRLCRMHPRERCEEGRAGWVQLQVKYPVLQTVAPPPMP